MSETVSLFDLISSVDAMSQCALMARAKTAPANSKPLTGDTSSDNVQAKEDLSPRTTLLPYAFNEKFSLFEEPDALTFYEVEGFGVEMAKFYEFVLDDNQRLRKIFDIYARNTAADTVVKTKKSDDAARVDPSPSLEKTMFEHSEKTGEAASVQSDLETEIDLAQDSHDFGELIESAHESGADFADSGLPELFVEDDGPELFFDDPRQNSFAGRDFPRPYPPVSSVEPVDNDTVKAHTTGDFSDDNDITDSETGASLIRFDTSPDSVHIENDNPENEAVSAASAPVSAFVPSMHAPVTHYPLREEELEDIESEIAAEPSLIIEERLDDIYERLSECRRTGIDITDSVVLLNTDRDIERLLNSKVPLETADLRRLLNHFDSLIGKLPDNERESFARSEYFSLYLHVMNQLENANA